MSFSPHPSAHRALLELERSSVAPAELLSEAADILGVEFDTIRDDLLEALEAKSLRHSIKFAPKEEWVLRWLLKKTGPDGKSTSPNFEGQSSANDDPRKWLLFYHLVRTTPVKKVAKILREQNAMRQIQDALTRLLKVQKTSTSARALSMSEDRTLSQGDDYYVLPQGSSKKRKRLSKSSELSGTNSSNFQIIFSVLRALKVCSDNISTANKEDVIARQHMRIALSLPPETAATLLGSMISNVNIILSDPSRSTFQDILLNLLNDALGLWDLRHGPDLGHTSNESNKVFIAHCLLPSLSLLRVIRDLKCAERHKDLKDRLDRLIALHGVEPVRKAFFDEMAKSWQANQDPLLPEHLKATIDQLQCLMFPSSAAESQPDDADGVGLNLVVVAPTFFEIAIRSYPRSTVRKAQHEQPWLEALLICLAHMTGCSLISPDEALPEKAGMSDLSTSMKTRSPNVASLSCLEELVSTVIQWQLSISLPLLTSLTLHFASLQPHQSTNWALVTKIMKLDVNIFLPNSGMSTAGALLAQLEEALQNQYDKLARRDGMSLDRQTLVNVLSLLIKGFASARDLGSFVSMWINRLATVKDVPTLKFSIDEDVPSYSLWEDEDVIAEFSVVAKTYATPTFIESHLMATAQALSDNVYNGRHCGLIIVLDALITTHEEEISSDKALIDMLFGEIQNAILAVKTSEKQTGWLWRLLRHVFPLTGKEFPSLLFKNLLDAKEPPIIEKVMENAKGQPGPYFASMLYFSEVERFHCFIFMFTGGQSLAKDHLEVEIKTLARHLAELLTGDEMKNFVARQLWDGRATSLDGRPGVVMSLLGILLQNTQVLCRNIDTTIDLLKTMAPAIEFGTSSEPQPGLSFIFEALLLDESLIRTPGFVRKCIKATGLLEKDRMNDRKLKIIQALPREAMSKPQRQQIAEWQRNRVEALTQVAGAESDTASDDAHKPQQATMSSLEDSAMTFGDFQMSCHSAREAIQLQTTENITSLFEKLHQEEPVSSAQIILLGSMLHKGGPMSLHVTSVASDLSASLSQSRNLDTFCLTADCIKIILDQHHESVNQWTIDNLLACIAITLSPKGPPIPNAAPIIFERLCHLVGTLLSRYLLRLGGRYHLLIPVLNNLLHCLFAPEPNSLTTQPQLDFHSKLPPWILLSASVSATKLSKPSSTHLTRLLNSICNPTPSSVKKSHHHNNNPLTDDTKKARRIAGTYMQYFIAEYAHCQLHGRVGVEAKEGLMPGLYAILDGMGREVMRAMNARMDASQRAIWKGLYEDWIRFGRWNGM